MAAGEAREVLERATRLDAAGREAEAIPLYRHFTPLAVLCALALWSDGRRGDAARALIDALLSAQPEHAGPYAAPIRRYAAELEDG